MLSLYRHATTAVVGRTVVNDAASCLPAATAALVAGLDRPFALVCGGDRQRYRPGEFDGLARAVAGNPRAVRVCTLGPMSAYLAEALRAAGFAALDPCACLEQAVEHALDRCAAPLAGFEPHGAGRPADHPVAGESGA